MTVINPKQFVGQEDARIIFAGEIWLRDELGIDVDLTHFEEFIPDGVRAPSNSPFGIERSDELEIFESDFAAAKALAAVLSVATDHQYTIWYEAERDD